MRRAAMSRPVLVLGMGLVLAMLASRAKAVPPACFAERTVLSGAELLGEDGSRLAALRAGHVVRVLEDGVGPRGAEARVEVDAPLHLVGRIAREALAVFGRDDIEVVEDRVYWLAGRGLRIERGDERSARVTWDERVEGAAPYPAVSVACARLSGVPLTPLRIDRCEGARPSVASSLPEPVVSWTTPHHVTIRSLGGSAPPRVGYAVYDATLLERRGEQVLVEGRDSLHAVRFRSLLPALGMHTRKGRVRSGHGYGVCWGKFDQDRGLSAGALAVATPLHSSAKASGAVATLPAGAYLRWHERDGERVRVSWFWPSAASTKYTFAIEGWVRTEALPSLSADSETQVHGSVAAASGHALPAGLRIVASWFSETTTVFARTRPDAAGGFRVAGEESDFTLRAESDDGAWVSENVRAEPWPGGTDPRTLVLTLAPAFRVRGRVLDERGRPVADVDVDVERDAPTPASYVWTRTDAAGRFEAALPAGSHELRVHARDDARVGQLRLALSSEGPAPPPVELRLGRPPSGAAP